MTALARRGVAGAAAALAAALVVSGETLESAPVTGTALLTTLNSHHPAFGAELPTETADITFDEAGGEADALAIIGAVVAPGDVGYEDGGSASDSTTVLSFTRRLEVGKSVDITRLEAFFATDMEMDVTKLPTKAEHNPIAWPSSYWPVYADSINYRWAGDAEPSPAEKYAAAFGHDVQTFIDSVSANNGIDSQAKRRACAADADCASLNDGSVCAIRRGASAGYCIPTWFGICHAWAPASILEAEPTCAVTRNGTTFEPYDIKALLTLAYDGSSIPTVFTGTRFNGNDNAPNNTDQYGRYTDAKRRDLSPGFFHIAIANIMGIHNHSFVVDVTAGAEVWNQPARSFEVREMTWFTPADAASRFYNASAYPFNANATWIAKVTTRFQWVVESGENGPLVETGRVDEYTQHADYEYLLETDDAYEILGGEWLHGSNQAHPDFLWLPATKPDNGTTTDVGLVYAEVEELLYASVNGDC